jgi:hypothetical protein
MAQLSAHSAHASHHEALAHENTHAPGFARGLALALIGIGVLACIGTVLYALGGEKQAKHAIFSYHVGALAALGLALGPLGIIMIMHQVGAGWVVSLRRQMENMASMMPLAVLLLLPGLVFAPKLYKWMSGDPALMQDALYVHKQPFLNAPFFYARVAVYFAVWLLLAWRLTGLSYQQDLSGDKRLSSRAKFISAPGLLLFGLTCAFASFDLVMSMDFHWFSTMFGVYFFAGNMVASLGMIAIVCGLLVRSGKCRGLITPEHFHDLGKMMFAFTVFWAYVTFSQYFLYWYANIPEATAWFKLRSVHGWEYLGIVLMFGHFVVPFLILLFRDVKRSTIALPLIGAWLVLMHCVDLFWQVRPIVYKMEGMGVETIPGKVGFAWVDIAGLIGPLAIFLGALLLKVASKPLIPLKDPFLHETLEHKNYV